VRGASGWLGTVGGGVGEKPNHLRIDPYVCSSCLSKAELWISFAKRYPLMEARVDIANRICIALAKGRELTAEQQNYLDGLLEAAGERFGHD